MTPRMIDVASDVRRLEANASQLTTAIHWLSASLVEEARNGRSLGLAMAAQMNGPVRALSMALLNLNDGVAGLLADAETDLRNASQAPDLEQDLTQLLHSISTSQAVH